MGSHKIIKSASNFNVQQNQYQCFKGLYEARQIFIVSPTFKNTIIRRNGKIYWRMIFLMKVITWIT